LKELHTVIDRIVADMPAQRKRIYFLHRQQGMKTTEIAGQLGITPSTVKNALSAAVKTIRERLAESGYLLYAIYIVNRLF
jgi:RNA polymerase sigma factor (sigma-70 family)